MHAKKAKALGLSFLLAAAVAMPLSAAPSAWAEDADSTPPPAQPAAANIIEVNGVGYATLESALAAVPADQPAAIKLLDDVVIPDGAKIALASDVTINLNGHALTSNDSKDRPIYVKSSGSITIDGTAAGSSVVIANPASYGLLEADLGADVTLRGGSYSGDTENGCLFRVKAPAAGDTKVVLEDLIVDTNYSVFKTSPDTIPGGSNFELSVKGGSYTSDGLNQIFYTDTIDRALATFDGVTANVNGGSCVVELAGSHGVFKNCNFTVNGTNANSFSDTAVFVGYRGKATIESGSYTSKGHGAYIGTSGGEIEVLGGTIQGDKGSIQADADGDSYKGAESVVSIKGGTIQGDLGGVTHGKATSALIVTGGDISGDINLKENGTGGDASASVSGGTFDREIAEEHCAEGFAPVKNEDGSFGVAPAADTVALVTMNGVSAGFPSLEEAFTHIPEGASATVQLLKEEDISDAVAEIVVPAGASVNLDLNGQTLKAANNGALVAYGTLTISDSTDANANGTGTGVILAVKPYSSAYSSGIAIAKNGGTLVLESGLVDCSSEFAPDNASKGQFGLTVANATADASVIVNGGKIIAGWYCVAGNGTNTSHSGAIVVNGGELISTADYAIYSPQAGGVEVNGGSVTGAAGAVHIQRGELSVTGGELVSLGTGSTGNWGDGTSGSGNATVNFAGNYGPVNSEITGGTFVAEGDAELLHAGDKHPADVQVSGGTFNKPVADDMLAPGFGLGEPDENGNYNVHKHEWAADLSHDETGHWHGCVQCDAKDAVVPHEAAAELAGVVGATCGEGGYTGDKVCKNCGFALEKGTVVPATGAHVCDTWTSDDACHWHVCTVCSKPYGTAVHAFGDWTVTKEATATESGMREHACTVCGAVVSEVIPAGGAVIAPDSNASGQTAENGALIAKTGDFNAPIVIGVFVIAAVAAGVLVFAFRRSRQK